MPDIFGAEWAEKLREFLRGQTNVVVLGMGNELMADDIAGKLVVDMLRPGGPVHPLWTGMVPEKASGEIRRLLPGRVLIVDTVDTGRQPGDIRFFNMDEIDQVPTTHTTSPALLAIFLSDIGAEWAVLGIQPGSLAYLGKVSRAVRKAARLIASVIESSLAG